MKELVYYAQNREDVILRGFFPDIDKGFYVDVGAGHPRHLSVTKLFYDAGWHGINIEANQSLVRSLEIERSRDKNLGIGVSNKSGMLSFRQYPGHGLSTFSEDMKKAYDSKYVDHDVPVKTLKEIFTENKTGKIQFLKVDVEAYEYEVLEGNDWKKFRPEVLCIEANHVFKDWRKLLKAHDYVFVFNDGLNDYYAARESGRQDKFDYVGSVLTRPLVYIDSQDRIQSLQHEVNFLEQEIADLEEMVEKRDARIKRLRKTKVMLRNLARSFNLIIEGKLNPKPPVYDIHLPLEPIEDMPEAAEPAEVLALVHEYDKRQYTVETSKVPVGVGGLIRGSLHFCYRAVRYVVRGLYHQARGIGRAA